MRQFHKDGFRNARPLVAVTFVAIVVATSGCHWFKRNNPYQQSAQTRPLEVPPDLDKPNVDSAMQAPEAPQSVMRSSVGAAASSASGFTVPGERDDVFNKVGNALASTEGVTVASKAQLLGTYDVSYQNSNFLVRVTKTDAGVYVSAVDPRGMPDTGDAATKLIAALKTALGG